MMARHRRLHRWAIALLALGGATALAIGLAQGPDQVITQDLPAELGGAAAP